MRIGSEEHLTLLCREFIDTHLPFDPPTLPWPELDEFSIAKLRALPFWDEAIRTERRTGAKVCAYAALEQPPLLREAVALQGYEETRHALLLDTLIARYGIAADAGPEKPLPANLEWAFVRTGYGECIDSFFAFGLFAVARDVGFLPAALLDLLEPIVQEEVRHILFLVNWVAYKRRQRLALARPWYIARCLAALAGAAYDRARSAGNVARSGNDGASGSDVGNTAESAATTAKSRDVSKDGFTASGVGAIAKDFSVQRFVARCLEENERRFAPYDPRLLRPRLMPVLARAYLSLSGFRHPPPGAPEEPGTTSSTPLGASGGPTRGAR
jgi:hypothetical protein